MFSESLIRRAEVHAERESSHTLLYRSVLEPESSVSPAPLLPGEAQADYTTGVAKRIVDAAPRADAIEEFLTRDVIDLTWEILPLRRLKARLLRGSISSARKPSGHDSL